MKYDEIINFFRQGPPGVPGKTLEKYRVHVAGGTVRFVNGRPEYKAGESDDFRFVQVWFWRDWTLEIDDPLQYDQAHAAKSGRGPFLALSHAPASLGDKCAVVLFSPSAGRFMPHSKSVFDNSTHCSNQKLSGKQKAAFVDRLSKEKVKKASERNQLHPDYSNPLSHVVISEIDMFDDVN